MQLAYQLKYAGDWVHPTLVLVLIDADKELPCVLGPRLYKDALEAHSGIPLACVVANVEYETWFVASGPRSLMD